MSERDGVRVRERVCVRESESESERGALADRVAALHTVVRIQ